MARPKLCGLMGLGLWITKGLAQDTIPDADSFRRVGLWSATVIGDYIYLDGGEVSSEDPDFRPSNPVNSTLSIDCSTSWSPADVEFREIERSSKVPTRSHQAILTNKGEDTFYIYGGFSGYGDSTDDSQFWKFAADGEGGGTWAREALANADVFSDFELSSGAAYVSTNDTGFVFGGTAVGSNPIRNLQGFKTFNFTTREWNEERDDPYSGDGTLWGGSATFVERYGASGIIVMLGGVQRRAEDASAYVDLGKVWFYDVAEKTWHSQQTANNDDKPGGWDNGCVVGVEDTGDNDSFEIFIYGGGNGDVGDEWGTVHALSLPGFVWTKVSDSDSRIGNRSDHTCVSVGNSQLISLGGLDYTGDAERNWATKDELTRGIGIFNMNNHSWQDSYDAEAPKYVTHEKIRAWYEDGGMENREWSTDEVSALFAESRSGDGGTGGGGSGNDGGNDGGDDNSDGDGDSSETPVGAIAGGVVGGVAGIAIIGAATWFLLRRRRQSQEEPGEELLPVQDDVKSPPPVYATELQSDRTPSELADSRMSPSGVSAFGSMTPGPVSELDGSTMQR